MSCEERLQLEPDGSEMLKFAGIVSIIFVNVIVEFPLLLTVILTLILSP